WERAMVLAKVARHLEGSRKYEILAQVLHFVSSIEGDPEMMATLMLLLGQSDGELVPQCLDIILRMRDERVRAAALMALRKWADGKQIAQQIFEGFLTITDEQTGATGLGTLANHLHGELLERAVQEVQAISNISSRNWARSALANSMVGDAMISELGNAVV